MAYFPTFIKFDDKKILIVGGGYIASEKLVHLLDFTKNITLIAKEYCPETQKLIDDNSLDFTKKAYEEGDLKAFDVVIAAIDDLNIQELIYKESRNYNCLCNCVDLQKYCDFIFPSYVKKGDLTIAISTSGSSPSMAKYLKRWLNQMIPNSIVGFLKEMKEYRKTIPKGKERMQFLDKKAEAYVKSWKEEK